jgi:hypothetical protein
LKRQVQTGQRQENIHFTGVSLKEIERRKEGFVYFESFLGNCNFFRGKALFFDRIAKMTL